MMPNEEKTDRLGRLSNPGMLLGRIADALPNFAQETAECRFLLIASVVDLANAKLTPYEMSIALSLHVIEGATFAPWQASVSRGRTKSSKGGRGTKFYQ